MLERPPIQGSAAERSKPADDSVLGIGGEAEVILSANLAWSLKLYSEPFRMLFQLNPNEGLVVGHQDIKDGLPEGNHFLHVAV